jgi:shikimate kinase
MSEDGTMAALVYLVGFMGAGKTEVGRRLAALLAWPFVDLDREIEKREGTSVAEIFRQHGETHFRILEGEELQRVSLGQNLVVAVGGGCFCSGANREVIARTGTSVWLDAPIEVLYARCRNDAAARPLLTTIDAMSRLLESRKPCYEQARLHIQTAARGVDELARQIADQLMPAGGAWRDEKRT